MATQVMPCPFRGQKKIIPVQNLLNRIRNEFSLLNFTFSTKSKIFDLFKIFRNGSKQFGQI